MIFAEKITGALPSILGRVRRGLIAGLVVFTGPVQAERAPVVDSLPMGGAAQEMRRGTVPPAQQTPYYGPASQMNPQAELLYQLDLLQQEVQNLRGQLEQYTNDLSRMRQENTTRYRGLDERMQNVEQAVAGIKAQPAAAAAPAIDAKMFLDNPELLNDPKVLDALDKMAAPVPAGEPPAPAPAPAPETSPDAAVTPAVTAPATEAPAQSTAVNAAPADLPADEAAAYELTRELIRRREFQVAAATLQSFIQKFPGGQYEGHAWYWLGEVYMVLPDPGAALGAFNHLLSTFPGHAKEADATYKLAVVHDQLGSPTLARSYFQRVIDQHPDSSAASLAANYMRFMRPPATTAENGGEEGGG